MTIKIVKNITVFRKIMVFYDSHKQVKKIFLKTLVIFDKIFTLYFIRKRLCEYKVINI